MEFKKVSYEDFDIINEYYQKYPSRQCDRSTAATIMWRDYYKNSYCIHDGTIIFSSNFTDKTCFTFPVGKNPSAMLGMLEKHCRDNGIPMTVCNVNESELPMIKEKYPECKVTSDRDWFDYLYEKEPMLLLQGRKYGTPRNHINKFKKLYPDYSFKKITDSDIEALVEFTRKFSFNSEKDESAMKELEICIDVLKNHEKYKMSGGFLTVGDRIVGYSFGEIIGDTLFVHIEKADVSFGGAYQMLTNSFLKEFASGDEVRFVNREEDCGDEGLRKSKLSYHPITLIEKNTVRIPL